MLYYANRFADSCYEFISFFPVLFEFDSYLEQKRHFRALFAADAGL